MVAIGEDEIGMIVMFVFVSWAEYRSIERLQDGKERAKMIQDSREGKERLREGKDTHTYTHAYIHTVGEKGRKKGW